MVDINEAYAIGVIVAVVTFILGFVLGPAVDRNFIASVIKESDLKQETIKQMYAQNVALKADLMTSLRAFYRALAGPGALPGHSDQCFEDNREPGKLCAKKNAKCTCGLADAAHTYADMVGKYYGTADAEWEIEDAKRRG